MSDTVQITLIVCGALVALGIIAALLYVWKNGEPIATAPPPRFYTPQQSRNYSTTMTLDLAAIPEADRAKVVSDWLASKPLEPRP